MTSRELLQASSRSKNYQELPQTLENPKLKRILNPPFKLKYPNQMNPDFPVF